MNNRGFSFLELLIVVTLIAVIGALSLMGITRVRQSLQFSNSTRQFLAYVEKARLDSIRRHAEPASGNMATITVSDNRIYSIAIDFNGDGTVDPARVVLLPAGVTFAGNIPQVLAFNWRGRLVDAAGNPITPVLSVNNSGGSSNVISVTSAGDSGVSSGYDSNLTNTNANAPAVTVVAPGTNMRGGTNVNMTTYSSH
jgi:prepilin-type N-terminal cleavage/methylation domain-containing protein